MGYVQDEAWEKYKQIINTFMEEDTAKQSFRWLRKVPMISEFGEDANIQYLPVDLEGLFHYNYVRTWPLTLRSSVSGELDNGDTVLYISKAVLEREGYINEYGYWDLNWAEDKFIVNGQVYQCKGDTQVAQAKGEPLLFFIVLQRVSPEETKLILDGYSKNKTP